MVVTARFMVMPGSLWGKWMKSVLEAAEVAGTVVGCDDCGEALNSANMDVVEIDDDVLLLCTECALLRRGMI